MNDLVRESTLNLGDVSSLGMILFFALASLWQIYQALQGQKRAESDSKKSKEGPQKDPQNVEDKDRETSLKSKVSPVQTSPSRPWRDRLKEGLSRAHGDIWGKLDHLLKGKVLDDDLIEEMEELLYTSDLGPELTGEIMTSLTSSQKRDEITEKGPKGVLYELLWAKLDPVQKRRDPGLLDFSQTIPDTPRVMMIVGVNGAGKTTTIGKLATRFVQSGKRVLVGACDTFRAAAVDQLEVWCKRSGADLIRAQEGADPSGVAYQTVEEAMKRGSDLCLIDTAGRLHTKQNLMEELKKTKRVLSKLLPEAPHEVFLVLDAITGQNALRQAEEFHKALGLTGLIFTKCDGSSKAGQAVTIVDALQIPLIYIGVGEEVEDLDVFESESYLQALLRHTVHQESHGSLN